MIALCLLLAAEATLTHVATGNDASNAKNRPVTKVINLLKDMGVPPSAHRCNVVVCARFEFAVQSMVDLTSLHMLVYPFFVYVSRGRSRFRETHNPFVIP